MLKKRFIILSILILTIISFISIINNKDNQTTKVIKSNQDNLRISIDGVSSEVLPTSEKRSEDIYA